MNEININTPNQYLSTRQCAKKLQISLGTVQKMVEMGELVAWKTRGGHRRILLSSLEQLLSRRQLRIRHMGASQCVLLAIFKREENKLPFVKMIEKWQIKVDLKSYTDSLEGLMGAVEINPDLIYIDALISPVEQIHLLHYISRNTTTNKIPLLIDEGFMATQTGAIRMAAENSGILKPHRRYPEMECIGEIEAIDHPLIYAYPGTTEGAANPFDHHDMEKLIEQALGDRYDQKSRFLG
jgi:excisionase family DNA binding protein